MYMYIHLHSLNNVYMYILYIMYVFIKVVMMVVIVGVFSFSGGIAAAEESEDWQEQIDMWERQGVEIYSRGHRIPRNLAATAVSITMCSPLECIYTNILMFDRHMHRQG